MKIPTGELKKRFQQEIERHVKRWDETHPLPEPPTKEVQRELQAGKLTVRAGELAAALGKQGEWGEPGMFDVLSTPTARKYRLIVAARDRSKKQFVTALEEARDSYMDRILFDHENAMLLLRDFKAWRFNTTADQSSNIIPLTHASAA